MKRILCFFCLICVLVTVSPVAFSEPIINYISTDSVQLELSNPGINNSTSATGYEPDHKATDTTLMIYMCGSNMEGTGKRGDGDFFASADIYEICASGVNTDKVNVLLYAGGCSKWGAPEILDNSCGVYQIVNGQIHVLVNDGKLYNMGDPSTLSDFLRYGYEAFPAEHYALILWDHGGGALGEVCNDYNFLIGDESPDGLTMEELHTAFSQSPFADVKLDWIGFDACLMSAFETAMLVAPYAQYMIASEETEGCEGWDYRFLKDMEKDANPAETGERIVEYYYATMSEKHPDQNNTMSCVNLTGIISVFQTMDNYFRDISVQYPKNYSELFRIRKGNIVAYGIRSGCDLVDLGVMIENFESSGIGDKEKAKAVKEAIGSVVKHNKAGRSSEKRDISGGTGLSVYFPCDNIAAFPLRMMDYQKLGSSPEYTSFIESFGDILYKNNHMQDYQIEPWQGEQIDHHTSESNSLWSDLEPNVVKGARDNKSVFKLALSREQWEEYFRARGFAFQKIEDSGAFRLAAIGDRGTIEKKDDQTIQGEYTHVNLFVYDPKADSGSEMIPIPYKIRSDGLYEVEAELVKADGDRFSAILVFERKIETYEVSPESVEVYLYDSVLDGYSPRLSADLSDYTEVIFTVPEKRMKTDKNGVLLPFEYWDDVDKHEISWTLNGETKLSFLKDRLDMRSLYYAFEITDIFNNIYLSKPVCMVDKGIIFKLEKYDDGREAGRPAFFSLDNPQAQKSGDNAAYFSVDITSLTEGEPYFVARNFTVNGQSYDSIKKRVNGSNSTGFQYQEKRSLTFLIDIEGGLDAIETVSFDLLVVSTEGEELYTTPVLISR